MARQGTGNPKEGSGRRRRINDDRLSRGNKNRAALLRESAPFVSLVFAAATAVAAVTQNAPADAPAIQLQFRPLIYKNLLLRVKANLESDPARREDLLRGADALRDRAQETRKTARPPGAN